MRRGAMCCSTASGPSAVVANAVGQARL
jgi:hypothetical protein